MAKVNCWLAAALVCGSWAVATAQNAISAKAGLVQVADGEVYVNDKAIQVKIAEFPDLKNSDVLRTAEGRTEVLLTPGGFLRMADNASVRMVSTKLSDVRLGMLEGEALVEITDVLSDNAITIALGTANFQLTKGGIFRFDADPARMRVYKGEATVLVNEKLVRVKEGHQLAFNGTAWVPSDFDTKDIDALYRWSQRRAEGIAVANVSAARQSGNSFNGYGSGYSMDPYGIWGGYPSYMGYGGLGYAGYGMGGYGIGSWMFNPYFGMYTFLPYYGTMWSPFGYAYYTPITVVPVYAYTPVQQPRGPGKPVQPGQSGKTPPTLASRSAGGLRTPAFSSAAALRTSAVTHGAVVSQGSSSHTGYSSGSGFSGGHSGGFASTSSVSAVSAPSVHSGGSAPSGGGGHAH